MLRLKDLSVRNKMFALIGIFVIGFVAFAVLSFNTLSTVKMGSPLHKEMVQNRAFQNDVMAPDIFILETAYFANRLLWYVEQENKEEIVETIEDIKKGIAAYKVKHEFWGKQEFDPEIKDLALVKADKPVQEYFAIAQNELFPAALRGDKQKVSELINGPLKKYFIAHRDLIRQTDEQMVNNLKKGNEEAASVTEWQTTILIIVSVFIIALVLLVGWMITRSLVGPLALVVEKLKLMSVGDADQTLDYQSKDEIGMLSDAFRLLVGYMKETSLTINAVSRGDLSREITVLSEKDLVSNNLKQAVASLRGLNDQTILQIKAAQDGRLDERGDVSKFSGAFADIISGINQLMDTVVTPLNEASECLQRVAERDLTAKMKGDYRGEFAKMKDALNKALDNLDAGLLQINSGAEQVASASNEISSGSQTLAGGASEQASTLEEISSSLLEIASMTKQNTENSREARSMSDNARTTTVQGMKSMALLSSAVEKIKESSDSTAKIVKTIEEIAFQTNLLALNAAVEAARAGDAGKGFAVVAEEVRNLAMRSADAAKTTSQLIDESVKNTEAGVTFNAEVLSNLEEINRQVEKVNIVVTEIAAASEQQSQGVEQITVAIEQMNGATQQAAANSEESARAAEELAGQSQEMLSLIGEFKLSNQVRQTRRTTTPKRTPRPVQAVNGARYQKNGNGNGNGNGRTKLSANDLIPFDELDDSILSDFYPHPLTSRSWRRGVYPIRHPDSL